MLQSTDSSVSHIYGVLSSRIQKPVPLNVSDKILTTLQSKSNQQFMDLLQLAVNIWAQIRQGSTSLNKNTIISSTIGNEIEEPYEYTIARINLFTLLSCTNQCYDASQILDLMKTPSKYGPVSDTKDRIRLTAEIPIVPTEIPGLCMNSLTVGETRTTGNTSTAVVVRHSARPPNGQQKSLQTLKEKNFLTPITPSPKLPHSPTPSLPGNTRKWDVFSACWPNRKK